MAGRAGVIGVRVAGVVLEVPFVGEGVQADRAGAVGRLVGLAGLEEVFGPEEFPVGIFGVGSRC